MSHEDIIRAWKDPEYRMSLSEEERAQLPEHPAGLIELTDAEMEAVAGGDLFGARGRGTYRPGTRPIPNPKPSTRIADTCNTKTTKPYPGISLF
jgi:mersacidin/lichenicidin family type 2 lantibiotic